MNRPTLDELMGMGPSKEKIALQSEYQLSINELNELLDTVDTFSMALRDTPSLNNYQAAEREHAAEIEYNLAIDTAAQAHKEKGSLRAFSSKENIQRPSTKILERITNDLKRVRSAELKCEYVFSAHHIELEKSFADFAQVACRGDDAIDAADQYRRYRHFKETKLFQVLIEKINSIGYY